MLPLENFEILVLRNAISSVLRGQILSKMFSKSIVIFMLIFLARLRVEEVNFILYFVRFLKLFWISLSAKYTDSMCLAPAQFLCQSPGDCTLSIVLQVRAILVGIVADWSFHVMGSVKLFSSVKIRKIQRIQRVHITVHIILFDNM